VGSIPTPNGIPNTITSPLVHPTLPNEPTSRTVYDIIPTNHRPACYFLSFRRPKKGKTKNGII
jgi:hypothetical protein